MPLPPSGDELAQAVSQRRQALRAEATQCGDSKIPTPEDDAPLWGLALSGGGIRSATFCLGLLRSLAASGLLLRFDVLSTVSGGGYIGGMVGRLFDRARAGAGAQKVNDAIAQAERTHFGWWVRANGRYLTPAGAMDTLFALSLYLRNLIGIHVEFGIIAALVALALCAFDLLAWQGLDLWGSHAPGLFAWIEWLQPWLPTLWLVSPLAMLAAACHVLAYWQLQWARARHIGTVLGGVGATSIAVIAALALGIHQVGGFEPGTASIWRIPMLCAAGVLLALGISSTLTAHFIAGGPLGSVGAARNALTHGLSRSLIVLGICLGLGVLERLAWLLAFESFATADFGLALGAAAVGLRGAAPLLTGQGHRAPAWMRTIGAWSLQAVGYLLSLSLFIWWAALVMKLVMAPVFDTPTIGAAASARQFALVEFGTGWTALAATAFLVLGYALLTGRNTQFLNLSSLHTFYAARLTRAYLGAANGARFGAGVNALSPIGSAVRTGTPEVSVGEVAAGDDTELGAYAPHGAGGPVHIINTCVNQSAADTGRIFNRDRKGLLLSVMAGGASQLGQEGWRRVAGIGSLSLGSWLAISGAAVSPGLGARTQRGLAALLTFGGVRLGYWLTRAQRDPQNTQPRGAWWRSSFAKSIGLLNETTGSFAAAGRNDWFISDGGHFENTGAYALLAARAQFILVADCGADPGYQFGDLENLVRKARVDLDTEIAFQKPSAAAASSEWHQTLSYFGSLNALAAADSSACLALATVRYPAGGSDGESGSGILIVIKPNMCAGLPMDIENYRLQCPAFPQQPTSDQFFNEAQWESYFSLGRFLAGKIDASFVNDVLRTPGSCFEPDDLLTSQARRGSDAPEPSGKPSAGMRLPPRIGVAAVGATLSAGAVATIAVSAWQAAESVRAAIGSRVDGERAAMKELVGLWAAATTTRPGPGGSGSAGAPSSRQASSPEATTALAAAIMRAADAYCRSDDAQWLQSSALGMRIVADAKAACQAQGAAMNNACLTLLSSSEGPMPSIFPSCVTRRPDELPRPRYWAYNYSRDGGWLELHPCTPQRTRMVLEEEKFLRGSSGRKTDDTIDAVALSEIQQLHDCPADPRIQLPLAPTPAQPTPAAPPPAPAAAPTPVGPTVRTAPQPTTSVPQAPWEQKRAICKGVTIYVQIYGPADRETVRGFREWWRNWGASVPPIEDVYDSARRNGRGNPAPVSSTVLRYHDARAQECAAAISSAIGIASDGATRWGPEALNPALKASAGVIELWVRPDDHLLRAIQARVAAD
ncbi:hypothetical protein M5C97_11170 [Acidovorax sp. NCPPB 3859]|nr:MULTISPECIES: hypothetical protein [unclassified Acidovorax]MDA8450741.1 hypothetical protein [Acidovorax sp. GBBC 3297]MDA8460174.1 hypothetical protein [Acidovorax sp. GBBC 3333]MDA8465222.1 hypothetical protein [Acidovorax sp. GBBC 3332]MDA8470244.1 hypothetical protein [Acidovorax sp. GBBC 3299]WCM80790.1 hypothetical protein M5C94_11125 [Acidovorax sp. GBBC 712]